MIREFSVRLLKPIPCLPCPVLHPSGVSLWMPGESITREGLDHLSRSAVESVFFVSVDEDLASVKHRFSHDIIPVDKLEVGAVLANPIMDQSGKLLFEAGRPIPESLPRALTRRDVKEVVIRKSEETLGEKKAETLRRDIESLLKNPAAAAEAKAADAPAPGPRTKDDVRREARQRLQQALNTAGTAFLTFLENPADKTLPVSEEEKEFCGDMIEQSLDHIQYLFDQVKESKRVIDTTLAEKTIQNIMSGLIRNRDIMMFCSSRSKEREYLVTHALATAVIASNVSINLGFDAQQVRIIVYGGMLSDIGMLRVPEAIRDKKGRLTPGEYAEVRRHPGYGMDMLERISNLPDEVKYIVYQSHERIDGSGYPHGKKGVVLHPYAQIVSIADIYSSIITRRPFREAETPYRGMEKLVLMCGKRQMSAEYVKGFLKCNSMFPVGSFLRLSDSRIARVVAPSETDFMRPVVSVLSDMNGKPLDECAKIPLDQHPEIHVIASLDIKELPFEADILTGF